MKIVYKALLALLIGFVIPVILIGYSAYTSMRNISRAATDQSVSALSDYAHKRLHEICCDKAAIFNKSFDSLTKDVNAIKAFFTFVDGNYAIFNTSQIPDRGLYADKTADDLPQYGYIHPDFGTYADFDRRGAGCPWFPKRVADRIRSDGQYRGEIVLLLDKAMLLTPLLMEIVTTEKGLIDLAWIVTTEGVDNVYPPYDYPAMLKRDPSIIDLDESQRDYVRLANPDNNPARATLWLEPYFDLFKHLWMTSCIAPLYRGDRFIGTVGIDILLPVITERIRDTRIGENGYAFLLGPRARPIALPEQGIKDLLWNEEQFTVLRETFLPADKQAWTDEKMKAVEEISLNSSPDPAVRKVVSRMIEGRSECTVIRLSGENKLVAYSPITATGWSIGLVVPLREWIAPTEIVRKTIGQGAKDVIRKFSFYAFAVVCISLLAALLLHIRMIRPLTVFINKLEKVSWDTLNFDGHNIVRRDEIGQLYEKFGTMIIELKKARDEVMQKAEALSRINSELQGKSVALFTSNAELERARDELRSWASSLERKVAQRTAQIEEMQQKLILSEKLSALGRLAGSLSHELRNPLGVITNAVYYLTLPGVTVSEASLRENLFIIKRQVELANLIVENALFFANPKTPDISHENVSYAINEAIADLLIPRKVRIVTQFKSIKTATYDTFLMKCVFMNVLKNGVEAIKDEGTITVATEDTADGVCATIHDTGAGITRENAAKLFEPLFTNKQRGIGLGLYIARDIVQRHKGTISITSQAGAGTTVTIKLPYV